MREISGLAPGREADRVVRVYTRKDGRVDLWICPPGTSADSHSGWAIVDVNPAELRAALEQAPTAGW